MIDCTISKRSQVEIANMADLMDAYPQFSKRAVASAMKSEGFRLKNVIQGFMRRAHSTGTWPPLNPHTGILNQARKKRVKNYRLGWKGPKGQKQRTRNYKRVMQSKRVAPMSRLVGGIRYRYEPAHQRLGVGFVSQSDRTLRLIRRQASGYLTRVTPKMRRWAFALGFPLRKHTTHLFTPPRPVIEPVFAMERVRIGKNLRDKYLANVLRYMTQQRPTLRKAA